MKLDSRIDRFGIRSYYVHEITNACRFLVRHAGVAGATQVRTLAGWLAGGGGTEFPIRIFTRDYVSRWLSERSLSEQGRNARMNTTLPRTCPRCRGSMIIERDWYGAYSTCLCCGYVHEAISTPPIDLLDEEEGHPRQRRRQPSHGKLRL